MCDVELSLPDLILTSLQADLELSLGAIDRLEGIFIMLTQFRATLNVAPDRKQPRAQIADRAGKREGRIAFLL